MIEVMNNEIKRGGIKIGYIEGNHIYDHDGKKLAYISDTAAFDMNDKKIAYIEGEYVILPRNNTKVRIEDDNKFVAGVVSDIYRAAIRMVLG
jgi:hypothetical protein